MSITEHALRNLVAGDFVDAVQGGVREIVNPATGDVIAEVPERGQADVDRAVAAAKAAVPGWRDTTPGERSQALLRLADLLEEHGEELCALESANVGKPMSVAREEMPVTVDNVRFFAGAARTLEGRSAGEYMTGYTSMVRREPIGVVGQIAPWNYPLMMAIWKIGPALATGNTIVLKPSELTPLTALRLAELAAEVLPPGVLNVITGDGRPGRRRPGAPSRRPAGVADGVGPDRQVDRAHGRGHAQARASGARRQGADGGARRRRPGGGRRGPEARGLLQLGPGLHGGGADPGRARHLRRRARGDRAGRRVALGR